MSSTIKWSMWFSIVAAAGAALLPTRAHAGIGACGDIHVEASARCEVIAPGASCEAMCTPLSVRAACAAQLAADCYADCDELPSVACSGSCEASCQAECTDLEPGRFDCNAACQADCSGSCAAQCEGDEDGAACMARCEGSCSASCEGSCDVELPEADCEAGCEASCEGSCEANANFDCQAQCQVSGEADCEAEIEGSCEVECQSQEGALFCDGEYVDHGGNLESCIDALRAALDIEVDAHSSGEASCTDGEGCMARGEAAAMLSSKCSTATPGAARGGWASAGLGIWLLGSVLGWRRRTRV